MKLQYCMLSLTRSSTYPSFLLFPGHSTTTQRQAQNRTPAAHNSKPRQRNEWETCLSKLQATCMQGSANSEEHLPLPVQPMQLFDTGVLDPAAHSIRAAWSQQQRPIAALFPAISCPAWRSWHHWALAAAPKLSTVLCRTTQRLC